MSVSEFKAKALAVIGTIARTGQSVVLTKRGIPVAKVGPYVEATSKRVPGSLAGTVVEEKDIVSPIGAEIWEAAR